MANTGVPDQPYATICDVEPLSVPDHTDVYNKLKQRSCGVMAECVDNHACIAVGYHDDCKQLYLPSINNHGSDRERYHSLGIAPYKLLLLDM